MLSKIGSGSDLEFLKIHSLSFRFGFGFVLDWVRPLFGIRFRVYLRLVENFKLAWGLTLKCACSFLREGLGFIYVCIYIYIRSDINIYIYI